jgi:Mg2+ and Co2+ transporter CorA
LLKEHEEVRWQSENLEALPEEINKNEVLWVDAQDPTDSEMKELKSHFSIDEHNIQELTQEGGVQELMNMKIMYSAFLISQIAKVLFLMGKWNA